MYPQSLGKIHCCSYKSMFSKQKFDISTLKCSYMVHGDVFRNIFSLKPQCSVFYLNYRPMHLTYFRHKNRRRKNRQNRMVTVSNFKMLLLDITFGSPYCSSPKCCNKEKSKQRPIWKDKKKCVPEMLFISSSCLLMAHLSYWMHWKEFQGQ